MIACTKLFAIHDVGPVIFKGALNFINSPGWLRCDLSAMVVRNCSTISGYRQLRGYEREVDGPLMERRTFCHHWGHLRYCRLVFLAMVIGGG
jgi:hypothetical protein